jgi:hypothetical protein
MYMCTVCIYIDVVVVPRKAYRKGYKVGSHTNNNKIGGEGKATYQNIVVVVGKKDRIRGMRNAKSIAKNASNYNVVTEDSMM